MRGSGFEPDRFLIANSFLFATLHRNRLSRKVVINVSTTAFTHYATTLNQKAAGQPEGGMGERPFGLG